MLFEGSPVFSSSVRPVPPPSAWSGALLPPPPRLPSPPPSRLHLPFPSAVPSDLRVAPRTVEDIKGAVEGDLTHRVRQSKEKVSNSLLSH